MSATTSCFEDVIGLSRTDCPCVDDAPVGANVSASGIYLDELPGLSLRMLNASQACGSGGLWEKLERAREGGIEDTQTELMACIAANTDPRRGIGQAQIGEDKKVTAASHKLRRAYHGLTLQTAKVVGGRLTVESIGTAFKPSTGMPSTITLHVYDRVEAGAAPMASYVLPIVGNEVKWTEIEPLELPMSPLPWSNPRYWFLFEPYDGALAMNLSLIHI
jgi:hypothetical protein